MFTQLGQFHVAFYLGAIVILIVLAWDRAYLLNCDCRFLANLNRLNALSLQMFFPKDYSALGLAKHQRPARKFMCASMLLKMFCAIAWIILFIGTKYGLLSFSQPESQEWPRFQTTGLVTALVVFLWYIVLLMLQLAFIMYFIYSGCFCVPTRFSGAADINLAVQEQVDQKAKIIESQLQQGKVKASTLDRVMLHVDMLFFAFDFISDGFAAWKYFELEMYGLCGTQIGILILAIAAETRVFRNFRKHRQSGFFQAFIESSQAGHGTDEYLCIMMREKSVEAPLSFLLTSYAVLWVPSSIAIESTLVPSQIRTISKSGEAFMIYITIKSVLGAYSTVKAAYVMMHLDLERFLDFVEGLSKRDIPFKGTVAMPSTANVALPLPPGMGFPKALEAKAVAPLPLPPGMGFPKALEAKAVAPLPKKQSLRFILMIFGDFFHPKIPTKYSNFFLIKGKDAWFFFSTRKFPKQCGSTWGSYGSGKKPGWLDRGGGRAVCGIHRYFRGFVLACSFRLWIFVVFGWRRPAPAGFVCKFS